MTSLRSGVKLDLMKKLSTYLFLILFSFSAPSFADDISDFQIEGMSVGDSLLDYFSKKQVINNKVDYSYKNNDFYPVKFDNLISSEIYDGGEVYLKTNDENYIIYRIFGAISFHNKNINDCYKKKDAIVAELSSLFKDAKKIDYGTYEHPTDKTGESKITSVYFDFKSGDAVSVICTIWSKELDKVYKDHLSVSIDSKEYSYWINNKAY